MGGRVNQELSTVQSVQQQPYATGVLRRVISTLASFAWITTSIACPLPTLADDGFALISQAAGLETRGHEHHPTYGSGGGSFQSDPCCDILGHTYAASESANILPQYTAPPDRAPMLLERSFHLAATPTDEVISQLRPGPEPPPRPWPQFTKTWSQAPPAQFN